MLLSSGAGDASHWRDIQVAQQGCCAEGAEGAAADRRRRQGPQSRGSAAVGTTWLECSPELGFCCRPVTATQLHSSLLALRSLRRVKVYQKNQSTGFISVLHPTVPSLHCTSHCTLRPNLPWLSAGACTVHICLVCCVAAADPAAAGPPTGHSQCLFQQAWCAGQLHEQPQAAGGWQQCTDGRGLGTSTG